MYHRLYKSEKIFECLLHRWNASQFRKSKRGQGWYWKDNMQQTDTADIRLFLKLYQELLKSTMRSQNFKTTINSPQNTPYQTTDGKKYVTRCPMSCSIQALSINTPVHQWDRYHYSYTNVAKIQDTDATNVEGQKSSFTEAVWHCQGGLAISDQIKVLSMIQKSRLPVFIHMNWTLNVHKSLCMDGYSSLFINAQT